MADGVRRRVLASTNGAVNEGGAAAMIFRELPDLPPRPPTPANAGFRASFYARWGRENAVVSGRTRAARYAPFRQALSIKCAWGGHEWYHVDGRRLEVGDDTWLVLNEDRTYSSEIRSPVPVYSFALFFEPGIAGEVAAARALGAGEALDHGTEIPSRAVEFAETLRPHDRCVSPVLRWIRRHVELGVDDPDWYAEHFRLLLAQLLAAESRPDALPDRIDALRPATRRELARRIARAVEFARCNLAAPLDTGTLARAAALSHYHFVRVFRMVHGATPSVFVRELRVREARRLHATGAFTVDEVARRSGLGSRWTLRRALAASE